MARMNLNSRTYLCQKCQRYDVFMASCVPGTVGKSTCGLGVVNAARSSYADVHSCSVRRKPARSRLVAPPVTSNLFVRLLCPLAQVLLLFAQLCPVLLRLVVLLVLVL